MDVHLLGPVEALVDSRPLALGATKQRALLAMLALEAGHTVPADRLIEGLWGEAVPPSAHKMVQHYVSQLRRVLDGDGAEILTRGRGYELRLGDGSCDVPRFVALVDDGRPREALELWRGPPLADVSDEPFADAEIRRLEDLRLRALEQAIDADLAAGAHREVLPEIDTLVARHPLSERLHAQRMLALYRSGRQAEALQAYRDARRVLVDEVGIEPTASLRSLHDAILRQDPALDLPAPSSNGAPSGPVEPPPVASPDALPPPPPRRTRWPLVAVGLAVLFLAGVALALIVPSGDDDGLSQIGADAVGRVDGSGRIDVRYAVGRSPDTVVTGGGSIWVASERDRTVTRIDPAERRTVTISVGAEPTALAYGGGSLWVADGVARRVVRIDAGANRVVQSFDVLNVPRAVAVGFGSVWVATAVGGGIARIDLRSGTIGKPLRTGGSPTALAVGGGSLWAASEQSGTVTQIDPGSRAAVRTVAVGSAPTALAFGAGAVWVANRDDGTVTRIDPGPGTVTDTVRVGRGPTAVAASDDAVWVANSQDGTLSRIDPATRRVVKTVKVGGGPAGLAFAGDRLWASAAGDLAHHRGGVLRVGLINPDSGWSIDPANPGAYTPEAFQLMPLAYDGLVAYRRVGGAGGNELVADLAESLPQPADDGRTYVFRLRRGLRYGDGRPVRATDFRASLERVLRLNRLPPIYSAIRGADRCARGGKPGCLAVGVATDDRARTIIIRLTQPDAELLHKLALPFGEVLPGGGARRRGDLPPVGTGPYRVAEYDEGRLVRFVRKDGFRSWSADARPGGFASEIRFVPGDRGADVRLGFTPQIRSELQALATRYGGRLRAESAPMTQYLFLNTSRPPFDDVRVRRAVNFATDRGYLQSVVGGDEAAAVTCRMLPPGLPGHRPFCPFTRDVTPAGGWTSPDVERARRLVRASGTRGDRVTVWAMTDFGKIGPYFRDLLRNLGYRASLHLEKNSARYFTALYENRVRPQAGVNVWFADVLAPSNFIQPQFGCGNTENFSELCDRRLDGLTARALEARDPATTDARWDAVERRLSTLAPFVPVLNGRSVTILSQRAGNFQSHPLWGPLLDQMWVR